MIRDRLSELRQESKLCNVSSSDSLCIINEDDVVEYVNHEKTKTEGTIEAVKLVEDEEEEEEEEEYVVIPHNPAMEALLKVYSEILQEFEMIRNNLDLMKNMIGAKNAKSFNEKDFYRIRQSSIQIGNNIMGKFQTLEMNLPPGHDFKTLARMKRILYYGLFQRYVEIWTETEQFLQEYETTAKKTLRAQSRVLNIELNEEEIEALVSNKQTNLYACNILEDTEHAQKTLIALQDRLGDLKKLEKSLEEVHTVFMRLQRMVVEQSVVMQSIEKHYLDAENYVEQAVEEMIEADTLKKKNRKYADVINDFEAIESNLVTLKSMLEAKNAHKFDEDEFNKIRQKNSQLANNVMGKFKKLESKLPKQNDYRTKARMQRGLYYGYFQQYAQLWAKHEEVLQKYEQQLKKNLQMQSKILNYDLTEEEIDTLIANKQTNLLMENILADSETARQELKDLKNRLSDLMKLEKSISEVHGLFIRLQTLVVEQGDVMQRIEKHFDDARDYVSSGLEQIKLAEVFRGKRCGLRTKLIIVGTVLLVLILLFVINSIHCFMFCKK